MATSGSTNFSQTLREAATEALVMVGAIARGDTPEAADMSAALKAANLMVKTWSADPRPKLWLLTETSLTLVASTASYSLGTTPGARKVIEVRKRISNNDTPLTPLSRQEYYDEPQKTATGQPRAWYFDPQRGTRTLYIVGVPDATIAASTTLRYTYLRVIEDLDALDDDFDVPQEWVEVIQYGLAARLALPYDLHLINPAKAQKIEERAAQLYAQLSSYDEESASVFFQPDC
jgi:hypothetical protein